MRCNARGYGYSLTMTQEADQSRVPGGSGAGRGHASRQPAAPRAASQRRGTGRPARKPQARPSLGGGVPAQDRELRAQGRETVRKLLEAGMIEFEDRGFQGVRVDDVVRRAGISHGTFYLYFSNKEDLFKALLRDALHDMEIVAGDFPVVTNDEASLVMLRQWVRKFFAAYAAHGTVLRVLSSADLVPEEVYGDALRLFFSIAEAMTTGMTAAAQSAGRHQEHAELTAMACLMMLERVNYLISAEVRLPEDEMADRIADIMFAAFGLNVALSRDCAVVAAAGCGVARSEPRSRLTFRGLARNWDVTGCGARLWDVTGRGARLWDVTGCGAAAAPAGRRCPGLGDRRAARPLSPQQHQPRQQRQPRKQRPAPAPSATSAPHPVIAETKVPYSARGFRDHGGRPFCPDNRKRGRSADGCRNRTNGDNSHTRRRGASRAHAGPRVRRP